MDASEIYSKRLNAKEVIFPIENGTFYFSSRRWTNHTFWSPWFSRRIRRVSFTTSWLISGCRWSDEWFLVHVRKLQRPPKSRWTKSQTLLAERRIIPCSTEMHWRLQKYTHKLGCYARTPYRWLLEHRWVKRFVWFLDRFPSVFFIGRKTSKRIYVVQVETNEKAADIQARLFMARTLDEIGKNVQLKERQKWSHEKPKLDNDRKLRGIHFIDPEDKEFKETIKNARKKLEKPVAPAMPCKISNNSQNLVTRDKTNEITFKLACILEASESTRLRMEESLPNHHEDHVAGKGDNSLQHKNWVHKLIPMSQAMKIPAAKAAVDKEWEKLEKIPAWDLTKVRSKKEVIDEARTKGAKVHFASLMDICHLKNAELEAKHQKYKGRVVLRGDTVKNDSGSYAVFTEQGSSSSQMTAAKVMDIIYRLPGYARQEADAVSAYTQVKMEDAPKIIENSQIGMSRHLDSSTTTQMAKIMVQYGRPSRSSWAKSVRSSFDRTVMRKTIWENPIEVRLGESFQLGMLIRTPWKRVILICVRGWHQIDWQETKHWSDVESTQQRSRFGRTNIFPWSCILGVHPMTMWNKQRYCWQLQSHFWITNFRGVNWKTTMLGKSSYFLLVLRYERSCQEMCGTILWVGKKDDSTTLQSIYFMHWWFSFQRRRIEICRRIVRSMLSNCSEILVLDTYWKTWYSMVSEQTCTINYKLDQSLW